MEKRQDMVSIELHVIDWMGTSDGEGLLVNKVWEVKVLLKVN